MSNPFSFKPNSVVKPNRYEPLGYSRNPFVPMDDDDIDGPFYDEHLQDQLGELSRWVTDSLQGATAALAMKGTIGAGKTRVLKLLKKSLNEIAESEKIHVEHVFLNRAGYTRPNVAGFLLASLETVHPTESAVPCPSTIMPYVWAIANAKVQAQTERQIGIYIHKLQASTEKHRDAEVLTRWLRRDSISSSQGRNLGIIGRIDAEGQQVQVLADLLRVGRQVGVLNKLFLFIDQLEDLMRPSYSELRKSRILEDLRSLIDYVDSGAPIGLLLSWSPEIDYGRYRFGDIVEVDETLENRYPAFYSRARRHLIQLDILTLKDAVKFATVYSDRAKTESKSQPAVSDIALEAWTRLKADGLLTGDRATPRDYLAALSAEVESRVPA
jgi:hypothetical protein